MSTWVSYGLVVARSIQRLSTLGLIALERLLVSLLPRKEVIHPHLPVRIPCYDLTPIAGLTLGPCKDGTSGTPNFRDLTGGVYKTRERIHGSVLTCHY